MTIKDIETKKIYYDTGKGKTYQVVSEFWKALEAGKIKYRWGGQKSEGDSIIYYSTREALEAGFLCPQVYRYDAMP